MKKQVKAIEDNSSTQTENNFKLNQSHHIQQKQKMSILHCIVIILTVIWVDSIIID